MTIPRPSDIILSIVTRTVLILRGLSCILDSWHGIITTIDDDNRNNCTLHHHRHRSYAAPQRLLIRHAIYKVAVIPANGVSRFSAGLPDAGTAAADSATRMRQIVERTA